MILKATLPTRLLQRCRTLCIRQNCSKMPNHVGCCTLKVQSAVPLLALVAVDGSELQGKNLAYMRSSMGKVHCSFAEAARRELAVVASTVVVVAAVEEHAVVGADLRGSVLEMVPKRNCCGLLSAVDTIEEVRSAVEFGCNMRRLDLPWQAFEEAVPWVMVGIVGDFEAE